MYKEYITPKASWIMKTLWSAAGGDKQILERATYSDQVKYMCLGGIVAATGMMAGLAGGYAFYTIFAPKDENGWLLDSPLHLVMATIFGCIWGLIIFNIDRFIVTSTGTGDGTEKITWDEFKGAIPRIIMGIIIAITISKPIEIRMFQTEIQSQLIVKKNQQEFIYRDAAKNRYDGTIKTNDNAILLYENGIFLKKASYESAINNAKSVCPSGGISCSVATHRQLWQVANNEELDWNNTKSRNQPLIDTLVAENKGLNQRKTHDLNDAHKDSQSLDGLLERIKIAGELDPIISLFITLLFLAIELTPIFFKMMLIKSPYDYIYENEKELVKAMNGIEVRYDYYKDKQGQERHLTINHRVEKIIKEQHDSTLAQKILIRHAIKKYIEQMKERIDKNPEEFINFNNNDTP